MIREQPQQLGLDGKPHNTTQELGLSTCSLTDRPQWRAGRGGQGGETKLIGPGVASFGFLSQGAQMCSPLATGDPWGQNDHPRSKMEIGYIPALTILTVIDNELNWGWIDRWMGVDDLKSKKERKRRGRGGGAGCCNKRDDAMVTNQCYPTTGGTGTSSTIRIPQPADVLIHSYQNKTSPPSYRKPTEGNDIMAP